MKYFLFACIIHFVVVTVFFLDCCWFGSHIKSNSWSKSLLLKWVNKQIHSRASKTNDVKYNYNHLSQSTVIPNVREETEWKKTNGNISQNKNMSKCRQIHRHIIQSVYGALQKGKRRKRMKCFWCHIYSHWSWYAAYYTTPYQMKSVWWMAVVYILFSRRYRQI